MATPDQASIDMFMNITGSSELVAIQKLTEHHGGLNEAVNSYFTEGDANIRHEINVPPREDFMDIDEINAGSHESHHAEPAFQIDDATNTLPETIPETRGTRSTDDDVVSNISHGTRELPSAPAISNSPDYGLEEEMVRAAIEASKRDAEAGQPDDMPAKQEKASGELKSETGPSETQASKLVEVEEVGTRLDFGSSSIPDETEDVDEQPLIWRRSRRLNSRLSSGPTQPQNVNNPDEWGGISTEEHEEAVMLEAAVFGEVSDIAARHIPYSRSRYTRNGFGRSRSNGPYTRLVRAHRPPSPSLTAQRLIREQQDDEYLASLQADREKELLEEAAREAAMEEEQRKLEQEQETERQLAAKEASLPQEPASDDDNAVTLLVRMPDGSRRGRRFMKSDKLQCLFDFIDVGRVVKPSTYRLVRPYPRRAFSDGESDLALNELGLSSKQEALFLELI